MSDFITRIELHNATQEAQYEFLHKQMEGKGFSRTISASDGKTYHLPPAEYYCTAGSADQVLKAATSGASSTGLNFGIVITSGSITIDGLKIVR